MMKKTESADTAAFDEAISALTKMKDAETIDDEVLGELAGALGKLSANAYRRFMDLPIVQRIVEQAGEAAAGKAEPGTEVRLGKGDMPFAYKVPYTLEGVYRKWPCVSEFVAEADYTIVTPGGWVFKLHRDIIYDVPRGESCPEGHGYQLPSIVISIIRDSKAMMRETRRETESKPFGMGVAFIGTGWAGKDAAIAAGPGGAETE